MATPYLSRRKEGLGPLSSGGALSGTRGGAFSGAQTGTGFTNAQALLAANQGKGAAMFNSIPGSALEDEQALNTGMFELKNYDPASQLRTLSQYAPAEFRRETNGRGEAVENVYRTPTNTVEYAGLSDADVTSRADKLRGLKNKFENLSTLYGENPEARTAALSSQLQKSQPLYSGLKGQGAMDSFLMESEAQPQIRSNSEKIKGLLGKFDGFDSAVNSLRGKIADASTKVGTTQGPAELFSSNPIPKAFPVPPKQSSLPETSNPIIEAARTSPVQPITNNFQTTPGQNSGNVATQADLERIFGKAPGVTATGVIDPRRITRSRGSVTL